MAPSLVISLIASLSDTSRTLASIRGGPQFRGWGVDREILALLYDLLTQLIIVSGNWQKGKVPKFKPFPRPKGEEKAKEKKKPPTLREVWKRLQHPN